MKQEAKQFEEILTEYEVAYGWLQSLITDTWGERYLVESTQAQRLEGYREQLIRTTALLDFLGNPQDEYMSIHVVGTGGKGSVSTMIGAILQASGVRVGVHMSPYLQVPTEKLLINGRMISPSRFTSLIGDFWRQYQDFVIQYPKLTPRYSEAWVALTHLYFAQEQIDWGVVETGMGGRFDPTNVLDPEIAVITNVDFDHVPQLGTTLHERYQALFGIKRLKELG